MLSFVVVDRAHPFTPAQAALTASLGAAPPSAGSALQRQRLTGIDAAPPVQRAHGDVAVGIPMGLDVDAPAGGVDHQPNRRGEGESPRTCLSRQVHDPLRIMLILFEHVRRGSSSLYTYLRPFEVDHGSSSMIPFGNCCISQVQPPLRPSLIAFAPMIPFARLSVILACPLASL